MTSGASSRELTGRGVMVLQGRADLHRGRLAHVEPVADDAGSSGRAERVLDPGERQREGITLAKAKGVYKGRKKALTAVQVEELKAKAGEPKSNKAALAKEYGISRETLYQYLQERLPDSLFDIFFRLLL